jgi:hypothetical protein
MKNDAVTLASPMIHGLMGSTMNPSTRVAATLASLY